MNKKIARPNKLILKFPKLLTCDIVHILIHIFNFFTCSSSEFTLTQSNSDTIIV